MSKIKFDVLNRFSGATQFTAEISCDASAPVSVKRGLAAKWAIKARANLAGAYLARADLAGANLARADLAWAYLAGGNLIDGGQRSDGYRFVGHVMDGALIISAGCRYFSLARARTHWAATRGGTPLGDETQSILDHIERVAIIRGLIVYGEVEAVQ